MDAKSMVSHSCTTGRCATVHIQMHYYHNTDQDYVGPHVQPTNHQNALRRQLRCIPFKQLNWQESITLKQQF